ncbi:MAG: single-stranded DNA-binding protein [Caldilineaceae bacterium]|nr:single-stranded DNA-binding protein [Caldilineaceae bacterium]
MYQQITLIGNLGSDPVLRYTPTGTPVCSFRMAVKREWQNANGEAQEKVTWFRVTAWQKLAEVTSEYLTKGRQVLVVGEMEEAQAYISKSGELAATNAVTAHTIRFLDSPEADAMPAQEENSDESERPVARRKAPKPQKVAKGAERLAIDIPF